MTQKRAKLKMKNEIKLKTNIRNFMEGKLVTIVMTLVTIFALIADDIRLFSSSKPADNYFFAGNTIALVLFAIEILVNSVVVDGFKYSFFFYLDIIATLSIISDLPYMLDWIYALLGSQPHYLGVDAIAGVMYTESVANSKISSIFKSLRLIRLIRIIKLYKYFAQSQAKKERDKPNQKRKVLATEQDEDQKESLFKRETDPSKLGKALSDTNTREVIIGVLLMLMVLPLLSPSEIDYSSEYGLRELFWMGRSNCIKPAVASFDDKDVSRQQQFDNTSFFCGETAQPWISEQGWFELLRYFTTASQIPEAADPTWTLLWLYVPDYTKNGQMSAIEYIPQPG